MKKLIPILLFPFFVFHFSFGQQTIYVAASNNTGIEDGTQEHPFNTIKEGINAASPGWQVMIKQGTYIPDDSWSGNPHTLFLKAGVSLMGEGAGQTIIQGIVVDREDSNLSTGLEKLRFDEFYFIRGAHTGPFTDRNIIRNCSTEYIEIGCAAGIPPPDSLLGANYGFIIENNSTGTEGSIEFRHGAGISEIAVTGNSCGYIQIKSGAGYTYLIDNNEIQYGIFDKSAANKTTISNNRIFNGAIVDQSGGNYDLTEDEFIENNTINSDENSPAFIDEDYKAGIIAKSRSVTIRNNTITCTGNVSGIRTSAGAPMHVMNNTIIIDEVQSAAPDPSESTCGIFNYSGWGYVAGNRITGGNMGYYSKAGTVEFANNEIEKSYTGFYSKGAEDVHHNIIKDCRGDGMILDGLAGPVHGNVIKDNAGSGIRVLRNPIDLGGGQDTCPGLNVITGNGNYDLYVEAISEQYPLLFARFNVWDHTDPAEIMQFDIRDGSDSTGLVMVDFTPVGSLGSEALILPDIGLFPNPTHGSFKVQCLKSGVEFQSCKVTDLLGQVVKSDNPEPGTRQIELNISHLPAGIYFLRTRIENQTIVKMIIKI